MTNLNPTNYNDWNRIRNMGVESATWNAPEIHVLVNFNHGALDYNYHNDGVLVVHFPQRDAMYYVAESFEEAVDLCVYDHQERATPVEFEQVDNFRYARYPRVREPFTFTGEWHHVSVITTDNRYHVLYISIDMDRDALIELIRTRLGGGR